jgi:dipeptidyl aminopeptidase/acylaminoacyl peptidase
MSGAHGFSVLPDSNGFLWISSRDGWNHLYRYDADGNLVGQLTSGDWPVHDVQAIDQEFVYFTGSPDQKRPYDVHVCRVSLGGGAVEQLTESRGIHRPQFAPRVRAFLDTNSTVDWPVSTDLRRSDGSLIATLATMDIGDLQEEGYVPPEEFVAKAADGETDLWGVIYKPADFDPEHSYPVIEHIYGGPQIVAVARQFAIFDQPARNLAWALAQLGFIVVSLDARGTPGRSKAFEDVVYGRWGEHEIGDHAAAIRQLCDANPWMDADRVGIIGHSWGGYFSSAALIQAPDLYKAAVSSSPGYIPWESVLYEPYLGLPADNSEPYDRADLTRRAAELQGSLLLVAGTSEYGPISDAMKMSRALIDAGIQYEFAVLPGEYHSYAGKAERYFTTKAARFLLRNFMPDADM